MADRSGTVVFTNNKILTPFEQAMNEHVATCRFCRLLRRLGLLWVVWGPMAR